MREPSPGEPQPTVDLISAAPAALQPAPSLQTLLDQLAHCPLSAVLAMARADQRKRWQRRDRVLAEVYLNHLPMFQANSEAVLDLIFSEIVLRSELGEKPAEEEYLRRFPQHAASLRRQFLLNQALEGASLLDLNGCFSEDVTDGAANQERAEKSVPSQTAREKEPGKTGEGESIENTLSLAAPRTVGGRILKPSLQSISGYEILSELGRGGMGVVYKARDTGLNRLVALKMILAGAHAGPHELSRLRAEAQAIARLRHPNIVQIYEVGEEHGLPYLALEYIEGGTLTDKLKAAALPTGLAAQLIECLALAMHHAHQQGIIHRDLKPANVLLAISDQPSAVSNKSVPPTLNADRCLLTATPKITDFGLAKVLENDGNLTRSGAIVGTPSYMAPEQAEGQVKKMGVCTDVYALGAILYEMLTGRPPFKAATAVDTILQVMSEDVVPLSRLQPGAPRDLETICMKCLERQPQRRYPSALALAEDLRRFQEGRPIGARPVSVWERGAKWARRRPAIASLLALVVGVFLAAFVLVSWQWWRAEAALLETEAARQQEEQQRKDKELALEDRGRALEDARRSLYLSTIALAEREWLDHNIVGVDQQLTAAEEGLRNWEWHYLRRLCHPNFRSLKGRDCVAFSGKDLQLAFGRGNAVELVDVTTGQPLRTFAAHTSRVNQLAFSPDQRLLASASDDRTVILWDATGGKPVGTLEGHGKRVGAVAFSPDGRWVASGSDDQTTILWDAFTGKALHTLRGHINVVTTVAFSPDGKLLASGSRDQTIKLWDPVTGQAVRTLEEEGQKGQVASVAFSPDGKLLASGLNDQTIKLWDPATGKVLRILTGHRGPVTHVGFSRDGKFLVSASGGLLTSGEVRIWDSLSGHEVRNYRWAVGEILDVALSADGKHLAAAERNAVHLWNAATDLDARTLPDAKQQDIVTPEIAFSPLGTLATVRTDGQVKIWDPGTGTLVSSWPADDALINTVAGSPDGKQLATGGEDRRVILWDIATRKKLCTFEGHSAPVTSVAFSPDGCWLASSATKDRIPGEVKLWDLRARHEARTWNAGRVKHLAFRSDSKLLAAAGEDGQLFLWDPVSGDRTLASCQPLFPLSWVTFSPDGQHLAVSGGRAARGRIKIWDATTGAELQSIQTRTGRIGTIAYRPDGQRLAAGSWDGTLKVFDPLSGKDVLTLRGQTDFITCVAFSPDGWQIVSASNDQTEKIWDATPVSLRKGDRK